MNNNKIHRKYWSGSFPTFPTGSAGPDIGVNFTIDFLHTYILINIQNRKSPAHGQVLNKPGKSGLPSFLHYLASISRLEHKL